MSQETGKSRNKRLKTLEVHVHIRRGSSNPVRVRPITLTNAVGKVVWRCAELPEGARLQIIFQRDPRGPFFSLENSTEREVIGLGNRGPEETSEKYGYTVKVSGRDWVLEGPANLTNHATEAIPGTTDPPDPDPPDYPQ